MTPSKFIGKAWYDQLGQMVWGTAKSGDQLILDLRGWGAIQNLFKSQVEAATFQDELGKFVADAINEKIERNVASSILSHEERANLFRSRIADVMDEFSVKEIYLDVYENVLFKYEGKEFGIFYACATPGELRDEFDSPTKSTLL